MSVTTCSDVNLSSKALTAVVKRGSLGLAMKLLLMRVTTCSGANLSTKAVGRHEARVFGPGGNAITCERDYLLGRDPLGQTLKAVVKLRSSSLAGKISLVGITNGSGMYLSSKALKAVMKLESLSLAVKLSLVSVTTCSDVTC